MSVDYAGPTQSVIVIPFEEEVQHETPVPRMPSSDAKVDVAGGAILRMKAFDAAWNKCLNQIRDILTRLHNPLTNDVSDFIQTAGDDSDIILPTYDIPTAVIVGSDQSAASFVMEDVRDRVMSSVLPSSAADDPMDDAMALPHGFIIRLTSRSCSTLAAAVKSIVRDMHSAFSTHVKEERIPPDQSYGNEDMRSLKTSYDEVVALGRKGARPKLVLVFDDFETFDPSVARDIIDICFLHISRLPFVFVWTVATSLDYVKTTVPRSTLSNLSIRSFQLSRTSDILENVINGVFFNPDFEPDVIIGPFALQALTKRCDLYNSPTTGLIRSMELMHMFHFYRPLSLLVREDWFAHIASSKKAVNEDFMLHLRAQYSLRFERKPGFAKGDRPAKRRRVRTCEALFGDSPKAMLFLAQEARAEFYQSARKFRTAFRMLQAVQNNLREIGISIPELKKDFMTLAHEALDGELQAHVRRLVMFVKKLNDVQLDGLLCAVNAVFKGLPQLVGLQSSLQESSPLGEDRRVDGPKFADCLSSYFSEDLIHLSRLPLSEAFCMGITKDRFRQDVLNPSLRTALTTALLQPSNYLGTLSGNDDKSSVHEEEGASSDDLASLPDASLLFLRSLDSGKMINLYDWFDSFSSALEADQKRSSDERAQLPPNGSTVADDTDAESDAAEQGVQELQARFVRGTQELEFMGLLRATKRKADHVLRVVYESAE